jgi:YgiT-type zinc finger domain-containing protein
LNLLDYFCRGNVVQQEITVDYRWGDTLVVINDVPAGVCQQCGEKYLSSGVYKELERMAKGKTHPKGKMTVDILNFEAFMKGWVIENRLDSSVAELYIMEGRGDVEK